MTWPMLVVGVDYRLARQLSVGVVAGPLTVLGYPLTAGSLGWQYQLQATVFLDSRAKAR